MANDYLGENLAHEVALLDQYGLLAEINKLVSSRDAARKTLDATRDEYDLLRRRLEIVWEVVRVETMQDKLERIAEVLWPKAFDPISVPTGAMTYQQVINRYASAVGLLERAKFLLVQWVPSGNKDCEVWTEHVNDLLR